MATLLLVLANVIGGSSYTATAVALRGFGDRDVVLLRFGLCALLFSPFVWRARARLRALSRRDWGLLAAVGTFGYALPLILGTYGQTLSSSTSASILIGVEPVSIVALSYFFLGERMTILKAFSLAAGLTGALLIAFQGFPNFGAVFGGRLLGDLVLAGSGFSWALYTAIGKSVLGRVEPLDFSAVTTLIGFLATAAWAAPTLSVASWRAAGTGSWLAVLYLAAVCNFLGVLFWNSALRTVEASRTANFIFLQPLVGVALGAGLLGDPLTGWTLGGGALVLGGMWAATRRA